LKLVLNAQHKSKVKMTKGEGYQSAMRGFAYRLRMNDHVLD